MEPLLEFSGCVLGETFSSLMASTGVGKGEKLHKCFLAPEEPDFWRVIELNLKRKVTAVGIQLPWGRRCGLKG